MARRPTRKAVRRKKATAEEKPKPDDEKQSKIDAKLEAKRIAAEGAHQRVADDLLLSYRLSRLIYVVFMASVPEPYMDEPFHVKQTQEYCAGNWSVWDEKITTFPGLYLLAVWRRWCVASPRSALCRRRPRRVPAPSMCCARSISFRLSSRRG